ANAVSVSAWRFVGHSLEMRHYYVTRQKPVKSCDSCQVRTSVTLPAGRCHLFSGGTMNENLANEKSKPKLRSWRFSLRFMFIVVTLLTIYLGMITVQARRQREVVAMVLKLGGQVGYLHNRPDANRPKNFNSKISAPGPAWLRNLVGQDYFVDVVFIYLGHTKL